MPTTDPRIDAIIAKARPFAQPILRHLRAVVHAACPDVVETVKWRMPFFEHRGILCCMAAFKEHCRFVLWKGKLILSDKRGPEQFGRITSVADLPSRAELVRILKKAVELNEQGVKSPTRSKQAVKKEPVVPADLKAALAKNARAKKTFAGFSPSCRREYVSWIVEAKRDQTRSDRIATAVTWMAEGKKRNWKYGKQ